MISLLYKEYIDREYYTPRKRISINGGFSLRNPAAMLQCLDAITPARINAARKEKNLRPFLFLTNDEPMLEDIYFAHALELLDANYIPNMVLMEKFTRVTSI